MFRKRRLTELKQKMQFYAQLSCLNTKLKGKREGKYCHTALLPENRVKNSSNPLVNASLIITCNVLSVCIVKLFLQLFCFFFLSLVLRWKLNFFVLSVWISQIFSIKPTIGYEKASTVFYIFLIFNFFTVFESSFALLSNAVFLFLDSLKCVIIFTFLSFSVCFYCFKKI